MSGSMIWHQWRGVKSIYWVNSLLVNSVGFIWFHMKSAGPKWFVIGGFYLIIYFLWLLRCSQDFGTSQNLNLPLFCFDEYHVFLLFIPDVSVVGYVKHITSCVAEDFSHLTWSFRINKWQRRVRIAVVLCESTVMMKIIIYHHHLKMWIIILPSDHSSC